MATGTTAAYDAHADWYNEFMSPAAVVSIVVAENAGRWKHS